MTTAPSADQRRSAEYVNASEDRLEGGAAERLSRGVIEAYLQGLLSASLIHGATLALRFGGVTHSVAVGYQGASSLTMELGSRFTIGCLNKPLLAAVGLDLVREGQLDLEAPIAEYLSEFGGSDKGELIRVRHLMSHSSGYAGIRFMDLSCLKFGWNDLVDFVRETPQLFEPGSVFNYELSAAVLFSGILERITGKSASALVEDRVLARLLVDGSDAVYAIGTGKENAESLRYAESMRTTHSPNPLWAVSVSRRKVNVVELLAFGDLFTTDATKTPLSSQSRGLALSRMLTTDVPIPRLYGGAQPHCLPIGWSFGMAEFLHDVRGHDGMGRDVSLGLRFCSEKQFVLAIGVHARSGLITQRDIVAALLAEIGLQSPLDSDSAPKLGFDPAKIAGQYHGSRGCEALVKTCGTRLEIEVKMGTPRSARFSGSITDDGRYIVDRSPRTAGLSFFPDPASGQPCLMCADQAFRQFSQ